MGCFSGIARLLLVIINILFLLLGLGVTIMGFLLKYGGQIIGKALEIGTDLLKRAMKDETLEIDLSQVTEGLAIGLIVAGLVLMGLAIFGCCGACYKIECMLWVYAIVIVVLIIGEAIVIGLLYGKPDIVKTGIKESLKPYNGLKSDALSLSWNAIMLQFQCCGVDNYNDFNTSAWYKTKAVGVATPIACCKKLPTGATPTCALTTNDATNNANKGCFDSLWDLSFGNTKIAVTVLVICGVIQLLFIVFAYLIIKDDKDKVSPI